MGSPASATDFRTSAWRWPCGTVATRSSRSGSSAWPNEEGNHGEDVKEYYYYLDGVPSHAFMRMLYKYPQVEYPYARLVEETRRRTRRDQEFELIDALGEAFASGRYFDVVVDYAKADQEDILCRITAHNRGPEPAELHILPHAWYRNTWSWGYGTERPALWAESGTTVRDDPSTPG